MPEQIPFSVVVPLYNKRRHIVRAIHSVLNQTIQSFELLVVDDGSTDGSDLAIHSIRDDRIRLIRQPNSGVSAARNTGIAKASHEFIAFLDADDAWLPFFLEQIENLVRRFPNAIAYATNYYKTEINHASVTATHTEPTGTNRQEYHLLQNYFQQVASGSTPFNSSSICIPKSTFSTLSAFPTHIRLYEDLYMWTRLVLSGEIAYSSVPSAIYFRDAYERACNYIIPTTTDLEFGQLISRAVQTGLLEPPQSFYASQFVAKYGLLNAFKATVSGERKEARRILRSLTLVTPRHHLRSHAIRLFSLLPAKWIRGLWKSGRSLKRFVTGLRGRVRRTPRQDRSHGPTTRRNSVR